MLRTCYMYQIKMLYGDTYKQEIRYYDRKKDLNEFDLCDIPNFHEGHVGKFLRKDAMFMGAIQIDFTQTKPVVHLFSKIVVDGPKILGKIELPKSNSTRPVKILKKKLAPQPLRAPVITKERCAYCGIPLVISSPKNDRKTADHIYPTSKGGINSPKNKVLCCNFCNSLKADMIIEDFLLLVKDKLNAVEDFSVPKTTLSIMVCNIQDFINNHSLIETNDGRFYYEETNLIEA